jgi:hypothetical protein
MQHTIDFAKFDGPLFSGRTRGENARKKITLDELESQPDNTFIVVLPANFFTITSSFFLGLFGKSIQRCGSSEAFLNKFDFSRIPATTQQQIHLWIGRALSNKEASYL